MILEAKLLTIESSRGCTSFGAGMGAQASLQSPCAWGVLALPSCAKGTGAGGHGVVPTLLSSPAGVWGCE